LATILKKKSTPQERGDRECKTDTPTKTHTHTHTNTLLYTYTPINFDYKKYVLNFKKSQLHPNITKLGDFYGIMYVNTEKK